MARRPITMRFRGDASGLEREVREAQQELRGLGRTIAGVAAEAEALDGKDINLELNIQQDNLMKLRERIVQEMYKVNEQIKLDPDIDLKDARRQVLSLERDLRSVTRSFEKSFQVGSIKETNNELAELSFLGRAIAGAMSDASGKIGLFFARLVSNPVGLTALAASLGLIVGSVTSLATALAGAAGAGGVAWFYALANPASETAAAINSIKNAFAELRDILVGGIGEIVNDIITDLQKMGALDFNFDGLKSFIENNAVEIRQFFTSSLAASLKLAQALGFLTKVALGLAAPFVLTAQALSVFSIGVVGGIIKGIEGIALGFAALLDLLPGVDGNVEKVGATFKVIEGEILALPRAVDSGADAFWTGSKLIAEGSTLAGAAAGDMADDVLAAGQNVQGFAVDVDAAASSLGPYTEEQIKAAEAAKKEAEETRTLAEQIRDVTSAREAEADVIRALIDPNLALERAYIARREARDSANKASDKTGKVTDKERTELLNLADANLSVADAQARNGASQDTLLKTVQQGRDDLINQAIAFGMTREEAEAYADKLGLIPKDVKTTLDLKIDPNSLSYVEGTLTNLARTRYVYYDPRTGTYEAGGNRPSGRSMAAAAAAPVVIQMQDGRLADYIGASYEGQAASVQRTYVRRYGIT